MNFKQVVQSFIEGVVEGQSAGQGNLRIKGDVLIHYSTPILERNGESYVLNFTRYSIVTGRLQKQIQEMISEDKITEVFRVPEGYKESLKDFIKEVPA